MIKHRMVEWEEKEGVNPLLMFPEGTTSNGRSILKFKLGAFSCLPKITIFGLIYDCQGFEVGMEEITPIEQLIISMCMKVSLTVKMATIEPRSYEDASQYMKRCQEKLSELTGFKIYNSGFK